MSGEEKAQRAPSLLSVSSPLSPLRSERGLLPTPEGADPPLADRMGRESPKHLNVGSLAGQGAG